MKRDEPATVENKTSYEIPTGTLFNLDSLPAFVGDGWNYATETDKIQNAILHVIEVKDDDRDLFLEFPVGWESPLKELPEHNNHHIQSREETGNSGHGETLIAGDFYIDWRRINRQWSGREWEGGSIEVRVRKRPDTPEKETVVASSENVIEATVSDDGTVSLGKEYAGETVTLAILDES